MAQVDPRVNALSFLLHTLFIREDGHGRSRIYKRRLWDGRRRVMLMMMRDNPVLFKERARRRNGCYLYNVPVTEETERRRKNWILPLIATCYALSICRPTAATRRVG